MVKETAGTCVPMGVLCEGVHPKEFAKKVDSGAYDAEINSAKTVVSAEKKALLAKQLADDKAYFNEEREELKKKAELKAQKSAQQAAAAAKTAAVPAAGAKAPEPAKK
jgi:peptidoglycan hydrolase CwlO-like protein